jgi:hypothetical protein
MTVEAAVFRCSICGEPSAEICILCTKDTCGNHRCERCKRCSDCCECEVPLSGDEIHEVHAAAAEAAPHETATPNGAEPELAAADQHPDESALAEPATEPEDSQSNQL